jgi:hypothetical protein
VGERDRRADDHVILRGVLLQRGGEAAIDFERTDRAAMQRGERGVTGAEIVQM